MAASATSARITCRPSLKMIIVISPTLSPGLPVRTAHKPAERRNFSIRTVCRARSEGNTADCRTRCRGETPTGALRPVGKYPGCSRPPAAGPDLSSLPYRARSTVLPAPYHCAESEGAKPRDRADPDHVGRNTGTHTVGRRTGRSWSPGDGTATPPGNVENILSDCQHASGHHLHRRDSPRPTGLLPAVICLARAVGYRPKWPAGNFPVSRHRTPWDHWSSDGFLDCTPQPTC